jgi:hypothetical protein
MLACRKAPTAVPAATVEPQQQAKLTPDVKRQAEPKPHGRLMLAPVGNSPWLVRSQELPQSWGLLR